MKRSMLPKRNAEIRKLKRTTNLTNEQIGERFNLGATTVQRITDGVGTPHPVVTCQRNEQIKKLYEEGVSIEDLCKQFGIGEGHIRRNILLLAETRCRWSINSVSEEDKAGIRTLRVKGWTLAAIADKYDDMTSQRVAQICSDIKDIKVQRSVLQHKRAKPSVDGQSKLFMDYRDDWDSQFQDHYDSIDDIY